MTRGLSVSQINASASGHRVVAPLIEMFFDSGTLRLACFQWNVVSGANTYFNARFTIQPATESSSSTEGLQLQMDGLDPAIITIATAEPYHGRTIRLLKGYIQPDSNGLIGEPRTWFLGRMRNIVIEENNSKATVQVFCEHYDAELGRAAPLRYADSDQERLFPGDRGCEFATSNTDKSIVWPSKEAQKYKPNLIGDILRRRFGR